MASTWNEDPHILSSRLDLVFRAPLGIRTRNLRIKRPRAVSPPGRFSCVHLRRPPVSRLSSTGVPTRIGEIAGWIVGRVHVVHGTIEG